MRLFRGQFRKLIYRPATRLTPLFMGLLLVLVYVGVAAGSAQVTDPEGQTGIEGIVTFPAAYGLLATLLISLGGVAAATYAGMVRGGASAERYEWQHKITKCYLLNCFMQAFTSFAGIPDPVGDTETFSFNHQVLKQDDGRTSPAVGIYRMPRAGISMV